MEICGPAIIPLQWFLGGPFRWDPLSRDAQLAWQAFEKSRCRDCGEDPADWRDEKGRRLVGRRAPKVVAEYICPGCEAIELKQNASESGEKQEREPGAKTVLLDREHPLIAASPKTKRSASR